FLDLAGKGPDEGIGQEVVEDDAHFYNLIREVLVANMHNHSTSICIEVGRQNTPHHNRPSFNDLEDAIKAVKQDAA
ncbi:MAG: flagellar motor stator protein MotA, partial [Pseudomonadota bacterium]